MQISHGPANEIIHHRLYFYKVCARCVPKQLMKQNRDTHLDICNCFLKWYHEQADIFLISNAISDRTSIYHWKPKSKCQSMEWKHTKSWESEVQISTNKGMTINNACCSETLHDMLRSKCWDNCQKCCVVAWQCSSPYCDPCCYAPAAMLWHIRTSPHGHDHAQSDIHLFGPFKDALKGYYFESNYKLTDAYVAYHLIRNMFSNGTHKLMQCWTKCTEQDGVATMMKSDHLWVTYHCCVNFNKYEGHNKSNKQYQFMYVLST
jgi:hypothetical protein